MKRLERKDVFQMSRTLACKPERKNHGERYEKADLIT